MNGITTEPGSGDLLIVNGGMIIAGTESQTVEHVLLANRGNTRSIRAWGQRSGRCSTGRAGGCGAPGRGRCARRPGLT